MLLAIGLFPFSIPTIVHDELQRRASWTHATSARIGARDATQFVGIGPETLSIRGTAHAELSDGRASLDELRSMANSGNAWSVVDGAGQVYGAFVIQGIDEGMKEIGPDGRPRRIDFGIDLLRVDDEAQA
ncbi:MAG TPA: phage tail protein [Sphingomonas sp.]|nr:phage tail protein [Sphingomonas sp.]